MTSPKACSWYYDWTFNYLPNRSSDARYVRMLWCNGGFWQADVNGTPHYAGDIARQDYENGFVGRVWLIYNEPDDLGQCNLADAVFAADYFSSAWDVIKTNDPTAKVFAGGLLWLNTPETRSWWTTFVNRLSSTGNLNKLEGVHIHLYPRLSTAPTRMETPCASSYCIPELTQVANDWYQTMHIGLGLGDRPIWISETGWLGPNSCTPQRLGEIRDNFMQPLSQWFVGQNPGYDALSWYVSRDTFQHTACTYLLDNLGMSGMPTSLGNYWNSYHP